MRNHAWQRYRDASKTRISIDPWWKLLISNATRVSLRIRERVILFFLSSPSPIHVITTLNQVPRIGLSFFFICLIHLFMFVSSFIGDSLLPLAPSALFQFSFLVPCWPRPSSHKVYQFHIRFKGG